MKFPPTELTPAELALQAQVREFLAKELPPGSFTPALGMSGARDPSFSRRLAERGWIGMSLPSRYGGGDRGPVDRFVVVEELLRWGAPVGFHWTGDRQSGPTINRFGTEQQRQRFLPAICRGEVQFAIGMSEPDAGSDLSALRTAATRTGGGWLLNGTKVWTSGANTCDWLIVLARTSMQERPQDGLTQFLVERRGPGVTVSPIAFIDGTSDFCEVSLRDVFVPDDLVLGTIGGGWAQNTAELAFERGGPDRLLTTFGVLSGWIASGAGLDDPAAREWLGATVARFWVLRNLSLSIARLVESGRSPVAEAALVKEMATRFEQDVTAAVADHYATPVSLSADTQFERLLARAILTGPAFTIRGGTTEILRSVVSRSLSSDHSGHLDGDADPLLLQTADRIFADTFDPAALAEAERTGWAQAAWDRVAAAGLPWLSLPAEVGGPGGALTDALEVLFLAGRACVPLPLAETGLLGGWLLSLIGYPLPAGPVTVVPGDPRDTLRRDGSRLAGRAHNVAWASPAEAIVALLPDGTIAVCPAGAWSVERGSNLAGEPRDRVVFDASADVVVGPAPPGVTQRTLRLRGALSRVVLIAGALSAASELTNTYTAQRVQFGRPVNRFQGVSLHLVSLAQQAALARMAGQLAGRALARGDARFEVPAAAVIAAAAAADGARAAHQAHGAMGMTREYPLQHLTRRLWSWRGEYLSTKDTARHLGRGIVAAGVDRLYPVIAGGSGDWEEPE